MPQIWLLFLGLATGLLIKLRRVLRRLSPLNEELYSKQVAVANVQSGIAWVRSDGTFGPVNQSFANTFNMAPGDFTGRDWSKMFGPADHTRVREAYAQMMLTGMSSFEAAGERADGSLAWLNVRLVAVHDGHMCFVGHHCMIDDKTGERDLERQVRALEERLEQIQHPEVQDPEYVQHLEQIQTPAARPPDQPAARSNGASGVSGASGQSTSPRVESLDALRRATGCSVISALNSLRKSPAPSLTSGPELPLTEKP